MHISTYLDDVIVWAPAKVNLFLEVLRKRPDGFHEIATLIVAVGLYDTLRFAGALNLPRFEHAGLTLLKRHTLVIDRGRIEHVLYPVFPSDRDAETVLAWLHGEAAPA